MPKTDPANDLALKRFSIQIPAGGTLFKQNDKGNTLYVLVEGSVKLTHKTAKNERVIATVGPGEIVGEKALCVSEPYRRSFTAIAEVDSMALEFDSQSLRMILAKNPDFSLKLLQVVVERLDKANSLISVLQIPDPVDRVAQYLAYMCEYQSRPSGSGVEVETTAESIHTETSVPLDTVSDCLRDLTNVKLLTPKEKGFYIGDAAALSQHLSANKQKYAA